MTACRHLRQGLRTQADVAKRRLQLLIRIDTALDGNLSAPDGIEELLAIRGLIREEMGHA